MLPLLPPFLVSIYVRLFSHKMCMRKQIYAVTFFTKKK